MNPTLESIIQDRVRDAMQRLNIPSRAALADEHDQYPDIDEGGHWPGGYELLPEPLIARVECIEMLDAIILDGLDSPVRLTRQWLAKLAEFLPTAIYRPLTDAELEPVREQATRLEAECDAIRAAAIEEGRKLAQQEV
jgi:hypothetical protein